MKYIIIFSTTSSLKEARQIANILLKAKKAACVNILAQVESHYWWQQRVIKDKELLLVIKTAKNNFSAVKKLIAEHHTYEVPEIVSVDIDRLDKKYAGWIRGVLD